ncbi:hypothetical protein HPB47_002352, partial [Ixodes persulcatus]
VLAKFIDQQAQNIVQKMARARIQQEYKETTLRASSSAGWTFKSPPPCMLLPAWHLSSVRTEANQLPHVERLSRGTTEASPLMCQWKQSRGAGFRLVGVFESAARTVGALSSPQTHDEYVPTTSSPQVQSPQAPHRRPPTAKSHRLLLYASTTRPTQCGASARARYCKRLSAALLTLLAHTEKSRASDRDSNT